MKNLFKKFAVIVAVLVLFASCKKNLFIPHGHTIQYQSRISSINEFKSGINKVLSLLQSYHIVAYLDTLTNGYPNLNGRKVPLSQFVYSILERLNGNQQQIESAIYDVFHFDVATFSLISYIRKAQMAGDISAQTMIDIISEIPLPPFPVTNFNAPEDPVASTATEEDCCVDCDPQINIRVTWVHKPPCGNYDKSITGYAVGNKFTHMSGGKSYRFDAEVKGCDCPGAWSVTVTPPAGAQSYGASERGSTAEVFPVSPGTYTITFTYTVCGKVITKTFTLQID